MTDCRPPTPAPRIQLLPSGRRCKRETQVAGCAHSRGFTLIESLVAVAIAGVLSSIAYPSMEAQVQRARRTDALVALMQLQLSEERHRANSAGYASLAELGLRDTSPGGHYRLQATTNDGGGYDLVASASGAQARDSKCRYLRLSMTAGTLVQSSGSDATTANGADANRACWSR